MAALACAVIGNRTSGGDNASLPQAAIGVLREGTVIPPTEGRVVMQGRRWVFIPNPASSQSGERGIEGSDTAAPRAETVATGGANPQRHRLAWQVPQMMLTENLNLQRVAEAVAADDSDDQWILSGQVCEYFGQNCLTIRTAQRSNSNQTQYREG